MRFICQNLQAFRENGGKIRNEEEVYLFETIVEGVAFFGLWENILISEDEI